MMFRYLRIIEFYQECKKEDQVAIAKKELQYVKSVLYVMDYFMGLDFSKSEENEFMKELATDLG